MTDLPVSPAPQKHDHTVAITAIVATAIVLLICIAGCSGVLITLALKIP